LRYETAVPLGRGATGEVLRAWDPHLERAVALKLLRSDDPELVERMQREARLQAKVRHPNVAEVYEVGEWEGRPYIAMQLVDGAPLDEAAAGLPLAGRVRLLAAVARAVHAAHEVGLIHRDLKPGNILVERGEDGEPTPFVVDFGIARETAAAGQTVTGQMLGTPGYMSPEQARGETTGLDRRSDVFSLGAVLYEVLTGTPPFASDSAVDSLVRVLAEDPVPPSRRAPELPRDLETVVLRCLEKEPDCRYPTARDLAEDLERFLADRPVAARPVSRRERLRRRIRRHPLASALGAGAVLALLVLGAVAAWSAWTARERAEAAQRFGAEAERMASTMRQAHLAPLHDLTPEKRWVEERMDRVRRDMERLGGTATGPGHRALGEGWLALGRLDAARRHLEAAWEAGHRTPETAYALGRTLAGLYAEERELAQRKRNPEERAALLAELDAELEEPALRYLALAEASPSVSPSYLRGLIAFVDGRFDDAAAAAREAREESPLQWEAALLEGRAVYQRSIAALWAGRYDETLAEYRRARVPLEVAAEIGSSDPRVWERLCSSSQLVVDVHRATGRSIEEPFRASLAECGKARLADPARPGPWEKSARAWWRWSEELRHRGEDPREALGQVVRNARRAAELDADGAHLGYNLEALAWWIRGEYELNRGVDPRPFLERGRRAARAAIAANPGYRHAHNSLGVMYHIEADHLDSIGVDSQAAWTAAGEAYGRALEVDPEYTYAWNNRGIVIQKLAEEAMRRGEDPEPLLAEALSDLEAALALNPAYDSALANRGVVHLLRAEHRWKQGLDHEPDLAAGIASTERANEVNPSFPNARSGLANLHLLRARIAAADGGDPAPALAAARAAARAGLDINPEHGPSAAALAESFVVAAEQAAEAGRRDDGALAAARDGCRRLLEINETSEEAMLLMARAAIAEARTAPRPDAAWADAESWLARARETTAGARPYLLGGRLALARARRAAADERAPGAALADGLAAVAEARRHRAPVDEAARLEAELWLERARWEARTGGDPAASRAAALELIGPLLERRPRDREARELRSRLAAVGR
jgi:eukaryotic-like serine/threonine-protein kinase